MRKKEKLKKNWVWLSEERKFFLDCQENPKGENKNDSVLIT